MKTYSGIFFLILLFTFSIETSESKDFKIKNGDPDHQRLFELPVCLLDNSTPVGNASNDSTSMKGRGIFELGYQFSSGQFGLDRMMANFVMSFPLDPHFSMGIGIGFRYYREEGEGELVLPVYADLRAYFTENSVAPFLSFQVGYSFYTDYGVKGLGLLLNPSAGIRFGKKNPFHIGVGYEMQSMEFYEFYSHDKRREFSGAFSLFFGILF